MATPIAKLVLGEKAVVFGWFQSVRPAAKGKLLFADVSDGSNVAPLVVVFQGESFAALNYVGTGVVLSGTLVKAPAKATQDVEFAVDAVLHVGLCQSDAYPLPKAGADPMTLANLRRIPHLRMRDPRLARAQRIRSALTLATHTFFQSRCFLQAHTPILTSSDCEGAGEMFKLEDKEFFGGKEAYLTVSGQLDGEKMAIGGGLGRIYTFGPTFRAENSHTSRHLAEFWMVEPEWVLVGGIDELCSVAEQYVQHCAATTPEVDDKTRAMLCQPFQRMTYTEAVAKLNAGFGRVEWGDDLSADQEQWLCGDAPLIVTHYPEMIKSFYMKRDLGDPRTVQAMDVLVPGIGELIGGSVRETDLAILEPKAPGEAYAAYLDTRRFGSLPHGGFGLGFERLVRLLSGMDNIRDVILFPRVAGKPAE